MGFFDGSGVATEGGLELIHFRKKYVTYPWKRLQMTAATVCLLGPCCATQQEAAGGNGAQYKQETNSLVKEIERAFSPDEP